MPMTKPDPSLSHTTSDPSSTDNTAKSVRRNELNALGFIILLLFPALTIAGISTYGFIIWMYQAFGGVVGH